MIEDIEERVEDMLEEASEVAVRSDVRAIIGMVFFVLAAVVLFLLVLPLVGAGVQVAGKEKANV